jgi:hypothetical protein
MKVNLKVDGGRYFSSLRFVFQAIAFHECKTSGISFLKSSP